MTTTATPFATRTTAPASDAQKRFIATLINDRQLDPIEVKALLTAVNDDSFTKTQASKAIDNLTARPRKTTLTAPVVTIEPGMYALPDGTPVKVQKGKTSGKVYAKALQREDGETYGFHYVPGLIATITPAMRMTLEEAAVFGKDTGTCCCCGRTLTKPESIAAGIGPICAQGF